MATTCRRCGRKASHLIYPLVSPKVCAPRSLRYFFQSFVDFALSVTDILSSVVSNYFTVSGPYGPHGLGSFLPILEVLIQDFIKVITKMQREHIKLVTPKTHVAEALKERAELFLARTAWSSGCASWFKRGRADGQLTMFPASRLTFLEIMKDPRYEDYEIVYKDKFNMFAFLGNGFSTRQFDGRDLTYYLGMLDGGDVEQNLEKELQPLIPASEV